MRMDQVDHDALSQLALFPLQTVLFPGGALPLRIFEARYVDMIRDCMRNNSAFGVVPITQGREVGATPLFHHVGTSATIETWDQGHDGLLEILARGTQRFDVLNHAVQNDGLVVGSIRQRDETASSLAARHLPLRDLLSQVLESNPTVAPPRPWHLDEAGWLSYRLAELAPMSLAERLALLDYDDAERRLDDIARHFESRTPRTPKPTAN